jgi:PTH1 family peptidyl-tRNA hydrolase
MVVDALAARLGASAARVEADALVATAALGGSSLLLVKPLAFMNRSGAVVEPLLVRYAEGRPGDMVVILDDLALPLGELRIRERGSHGGHNGLRSIIEAVASEEFPRLRLGIGREETPADLADYVLSEFPPDDVLVVQEMVGTAAEAAEVVVREGAPTAMNRYNGPRRG